jgi:endonuclease-8
MPEGHTIHRLADDLAATLSGGPVTASSPQGRFTDGAGLIDGETLEHSEAYGKYLFCAFSSGVLLHVHLGLIGKFRPNPPASVAGDTIRLRLENDSVAWHLTGPARCEIITPVERRAIVRTLGADPLRARPNVTRLHERLASTDKPIGATLLDQQIVAGIGNVYRAEVLFLCGIHPARRSSSLTTDEVDAIWNETRRQLRRGVRLNRIVTTDPREIGRPLHRIEGDDRLYVYHRTNCRRCGTELQTLEIGGRPIQFCPVHQPS